MKPTFFKLKQTWYIAILFAVLVGAASCNKGDENASTETAIKAPSVSILEAAFFGNVEATKEHIANNTDLNQKDEYGSTPLGIAAMFGKTEVAILLIDGGADLNATSADGSTSLHTAAFFGRIEIVKALLENKVDVTARNSFGATALESVSAPFSDLKPFYDQLSKDLGPLGLKLDYKQLEEARPIIAGMIEAHGK